MNFTPIIYITQGMKYFFIFIISIVFSNIVSAQFLSTGIWRAEFSTPGGALPFNFEISLTQNGYSFELINGDERIATREISMDDNVLFVYLPVFNSTIVADISRSGKTMEGFFHDYSRGDNYAIPFTAAAGQSFRFFEHPQSPSGDISGRWETHFVADNEMYEAVGVFKQNGNHLTGTFLTETGDYRYLQGDVSGNQFYLSTFDGSHAFLFIGTILNDSVLEGKYFSGIHWQEQFTCKRNDTVQIGDPESLTYLKEGYTSVDFCFPDVLGDTICSTDQQFQNKVTILQIMGTWCPNCMDESAYLAEVYRKYHAAGLEVVALAFERETDPEAAKINFERLKRRFGIEYPILLAGTNRKSEASKVLPMLNAVIAYPTLIVIDRDKQVVMMHTGFNGPATGDLYSEFIIHFEQELQRLLK